jgi:threonine/homoserine efflux transporter RhtA
MATRIENEAQGAMDWLVGKWQWPLAGLFAAGILLALTPVFGAVAGWTLMLVWLQLPLYMIHQYEEHNHDRFRLYLNKNVAHCDALTPAGAFWINSLGVWGIDLVMLYLAVFVSPAFALAAFYLPIINALTHIREAVARREYNPGLHTSVILFLPIGILSLWRVSLDTAATWHEQVLGLAIAIGIHLAIIVYIVARVRKIRGLRTRTVAA